MAITTDDFNKIWASTSPLTPYSFSASQYKEGWNFIGSTPPSRQMWDFLQKNNDEKMKYLLNNFDNYLPLSGGTLTGVVNGVTPTAGDNSTKIATTEFVNAKAGNYLPLSGGTVTGDLDVTSAITCNSVTSNRVNVRSGSVAPVNTLQRSTAYSVGDIVYTSALNAKYYLLCVTAGTTSATMPSLRGAGSNTEVTDGTVVWRVQTITSQESVETRIGAAETRISTAETRISTAETRISALENHGAGATVVESYRNDTEWYRVWSDGWIEQGGIISSMPTGNRNNTTNYSTITLPKAFADTKYIVSVMVNSLTETSAIDTIVTLNKKNTTNFKTRNFDSGNSLQVSASWFACGKGA